MPYLVLGLSVIVGMLLMGRWLLNADPKLILKVAGWTVGLLVTALVLFVLLHGRIDIEGLAFVAAGAIPVGLRLWRRFRGTMPTGKAGSSPGGVSQVRTRWLAMRFDHDSGVMEGEVLQGRFAGRALAELSPDELVELRRDCMADPQSVQVLETWLDRSWGDAWRAWEPQEPGSAAGVDDGPMTRAQALEILGLGEDAGPEEIRAAHRRLMKAAHPDLGGSAWLASRINRAKDVLLDGG